MRKLVELSFVFLLVASGTSAGPPAERVPETVLRRLAAGEPQDVIVLFDASDIQREILRRREKLHVRPNDPSLLDLKMTELVRLKERALAAALDADAYLLRDYSHLPMSLVRIGSLDSLRALLGRDDVARIFRNERLRPSLVRSLSFIGQPAVAAAGHTGGGTTVAILDTGVDYTHPAFGSCTGPGAPGCRVVYAQDFGADDGQRDDDGHGTNVAGIVLGVAPDAAVAALDVFNGDSAAAADVIDAINWSIANQAAYNVVAMNMSLGGGFFPFGCDQSVFATPFAEARGAGIVPVLASGNDGRINGMTEPACAPGAVRVGAVYDADIGPRSWTLCHDTATAPDTIACFSNAAPTLTLLAPGALITAAGLTKGGTSQAAPHVAGAVAVLLAIDATLSPDDVERILTESGVPVLDPRTQATFPRLNLEGAVSLVVDHAPQRLRITRGSRRD